MLLEVVLALVLFASVAMVVLGGVGTSAQAVVEMRLQAHAVDRAVTVFSKVQLGIIPPVADGPEPFEEPFEDWTWQITTASATEALEGPDVQRLTLTVRHVDGYEHRMSWLMAAVDDDALPDGEPPMDEDVDEEAWQ